MRRNMYVKTSNFLKRELFLLDAELAKPLLDMRMKTYAVQRHPIVNLHCSTPSSIMEFLAAQEKQRRLVGDGLARVESEVGVLL